MLSHELRKLLTQIQNGEKMTVNPEKLREELEDLDHIKKSIGESLSLPSTKCPTCGRNLR